jgi:hypothetical protein
MYERSASAVAFDVALQRAVISSDLATYFLHSASQSAEYAPVAK